MDIVAGVSRSLDIDPVDIEVTSHAPAAGRSPLSRPGREITAGMAVEIHDRAFELVKLAFAGHQLTGQLTNPPVERLALLLLVPHRRGDAAKPGDHELGELILLEPVQA